MARDAAGGAAGADEGRLNWATRALVFATLVLAAVTICKADRHSFTMPLVMRPAYRARIQEVR